MRRARTAGKKHKRTWEEEDGGSDGDGGGPSDAFVELQKELEEKEAIVKKNEKIEEEIRLAEEAARQAAVEEEEQRRRDAKDKNPKVYLDIAILPPGKSALAKGEAAGRLTIELFADVCPKTAENFLRLCTGELGVGSSGFPLSYSGCALHRIVPKFMAQGGDITREDGTGGESIYGSSFPDETFAIPHDAAGVLSMANNGPNTNNSQFFLLFAPAPWLDGRHCAFGKLLGEESFVVLQKIEECGALEARGKPTRRVEISACGQLGGEKEKGEEEGDDDATEAAEGEKLPENSDTAAEKRANSAGEAPAAGDSKSLENGAGTSPGVAAEAAAPEPGSAAHGDDET